jgi:uncharacterized RDD family membrane protein YckC
MSTSPPQDPYEQPRRKDDYQQAFPGYQQPYPGAPPAWPQGAGATPDTYGMRSPDPMGRPLVDYGDRVVAYIFDQLIAFALTLPGTLLIILGTAPAWDGVGDPSGFLILLGVLLVLAGIAVAIWNQGWVQGATGQSWGKGFRRIRLVSEESGQPIGGGLGLLRWLIFNGLSSITGLYWLVTVLFPLWDEKRQTLEDKMLRTVVVSER